MSALLAFSRHFDPNLELDEAEAVAAMGEARGRSNELALALAIRRRVLAAAPAVLGERRTRLFALFDDAVVDINDPFNVPERRALNEAYLSSGHPCTHDSSDDEDDSDLVAAIRASLTSQPPELAAHIEHGTESSAGEQICAVEGLGGAVASDCDVSMPAWSSTSTSVGVCDDDVVPSDSDIDALVEGGGEDDVEGWYVTAELAVTSTGVSPIRTRWPVPRTALGAALEGVLLLHPHEPASRCGNYSRAATDVQVMCEYLVRMLLYVLDDAAQAHVHSALSQSSLAPALSPSLVGEMLDLAQERLAARPRWWGERCAGVSARLVRQFLVSHWNASVPKQAWLRCIREPGLSQEWKTSGSSASRHPSLADAPPLPRFSSNRDQPLLDLEGLATHLLQWQADSLDIRLGRTPLHGVPLHLLPRAAEEARLTDALWPGTYQTTLEDAVWPRTVQQRSDCNHWRQHVPDYGPDEERCAIVHPDDVRGVEALLEPGELMPEETQAPPLDSPAWCSHAPRSFLRAVRGEDWRVSLALHLVSAWGQECFAAPMVQHLCSIGERGPLLRRDNTGRSYVGWVTGRQGACDATQLRCCTALELAQLQGHTRITDVLRRMGGASRLTLVLEDACARVRTTLNSALGGRESTNTLPATLCYTCPLTAQRRYARLRERQQRAYERLKQQLQGATTTSTATTAPAALSASHGTAESTVSIAVSPAKPVISPAAAVLALQRVCARLEHIRDSRCARYPGMNSFEVFMLLHLLPQHVRLQQQLGAGAFGAVYEADFLGWLPGRVRDASLSHGIGGSDSNKVPLLAAKVMHVPDAASHGEHAQTARAALWRELAFLHASNTMVDRSRAQWHFLGWYLEQSPPPGQSATAAGTVTVAAATKTAAPAAAAPPAAASAAPPPPAPALAAAAAATHTIAAPTALPAGDCESGISNVDNHPDTAPLPLHVTSTLLSKVGHARTNDATATVSSLRVVMLVPRMDGTLEHWLATEGAASTATHTRVAIAWSLACSLTCDFHQRMPTPLVHADIKSSNVLVKLVTRSQQSAPAVQNVKWSDFGLSQSEGSVVMQAYKRTTAPEVWALSRYGVAADVFAFGLLLAEALTGLRYCYLVRSVTPGGPGTAQSDLSPPKSPPSQPPLRQFSSALACTTPDIHGPVDNSSEFTPSRVPARVAEELRPYDSPAVLREVGQTYSDPAAYYYWAGAQQAPVVSHHPAYMCVCREAPALPLATPPNTHASQTVAHVLVAPGGYDASEEDDGADMQAATHTPAVADKPHHPQPAAVSPILPSIVVYAGPVALMARVTASGDGGGGSGDITAPLLKDSVVPPLTQVAMTHRGETELEMEMEGTQAAFAPPTVPSIIRALWDLIRRCLSPSPHLRPSILLVTVQLGTILEHWRGLEAREGGAVATSRGPLPAVRLEVSDADVGPLRGLPADYGNRHTDSFRHELDVTPEGFRSLRWSAPS